MYCILDYITNINPILVHQLFFSDTYLFLSSSYFNYMVPILLTLTKRLFFLILICLFIFSPQQMFVQGTITLSGGMKKQIKSEQKSKKLFELAILDENQKIEIFGIIPPLVIKDSKLEIKIDKITDIKEVKTFFGPSNIILNYYISVFWCDEDRKSVV